MVYEVPSTVTPHPAIMSDPGLALGAGIAQTQTAISSRSSDELKSLITNIDESFKRLIESTDKQRYSVVKVLPLKWEACDFDPTIENETVELQSVFRDQYGFDAGHSKDVFRIPSQDSLVALQAHISQEIYALSKV